MDWRPLSSINGKVTEVKYDSDGKYLIRSLQECDPYLDNARIMRGMVDKHEVRKQTFRHYAHVPAIVIHQWMQEGIDIWDEEHQDRIARKLNDPDNAYLRVEEGHLGHVGNGKYR